ncbi:large ribosomal RNA subunit accumulation protein YCED homolog 2, chloroplastic isoform X1 [Euphorbia lathyris]|uniref:large ribosomal RNA subunit accumulation protein YCED homolog 2, chloroplastic isoform X1 n=1 Tax=Euphorbia lathyris TaxID=212925 RepID=UPI003313E752
MIGSISRSIPISSPSNHYHYRSVVVSRKKDVQLPKTRSRSPRRRLVTISTGDGKWQGNWTCQFLISLEDLHLQDLIEDHHQQHKDAQVSVTLTVQKHASFGFSVDGRILTSFIRNCTNCFSPYCREVFMDLIFINFKFQLVFVLILYVMLSQIDSKFNVWVLMSNEDNDQLHLPEIGGDDPSVIYVKPGCEANLDSLIQDTLRLTVSVQDFCSEACEKSQPTFQFIGRQSTASIDKRWSRLLDFKKTNQLPQ